MLVPKLRFKREDGTDYPEWESMPLEERFTFKNGINASREAFRAEGIHCIGVSDVYKCLPITAENVIGTVAISDDEIEKNKVGYGDILFQRSSETKEDIGHASVYFDNTTSVYNGFVICAKPDELFYDPLYLHYSLQNTRVRKQTITLGAGSGQHYNIGQEGLAQIKAVFPCLEEQQRISDLVFSVDKVIAQSEAEVQNLEQQKKAVMQKIFSQEVRFKREDGTDYPEWEEKPMSEVFTEIIEKNRPDLPVLSILQGQGTVFRDSSDRNIMYDKKSTVNYKAMKKGDFIIHLRTFEGGLECATLDGISSPAYKILRTDKLIPEAYKAYFRSRQFIEGRLAIAVTGVRDGKNIEMSTFWEILVPIACLEEQQKIADFLSAYDEVISYAKQELDKWKELKKGLLQQMFV